MTRSEGAPVTIIETERLRLRELIGTDAPFILALVNDPDWLRFIGDRGVASIADAERYIEDGPRAMYAEHGFGLWLVETRTTAEPVGICGILRRDTLPEADLGFALLPGHRGKGLAREAAGACLVHARDALGMARVLAITSPANGRSAQLLRELGFDRVEQRALTPRDAPVDIYAFDLMSPVG